MKLSFIFLAFVLIFPPVVQAYLDPGTGSYITQLIIGGLVGGLYLLKVYFSKIVSFIKGLLAKFSQREKNLKKT
ncbi:MAG TPA: hypothetical protein VGA89_03490 [Patescibacteria group bacterium]|jgi:hypothetical protein